MSVGIGTPASELPLGLGGSLTWTSDYALRGVSQTQNLPALQAELHIKPYSDWTVGAWASTVHLLPYSNSTELDFYLDHRWMINQDLFVNASVTHYEYLHDPRVISYNYDELSIAARWADTLYAHVAWSPNVDLYHNTGYVYENQQTLSVETGYHLPLPFGIDSQVGLGYFLPLELRQGRYAYASSGLRRRFGAWQVEVNYIWVQSREHRNFNLGPSATPWVATVSWRF